jgi:hypothetical protein
VCQHRVTLTAAQQAIATDWTTAKAKLGLQYPITDEIVVAAWKDAARIEMSGGTFVPPDIRNETT